MENKIIALLRLAFKYGFNQIQFDNIFEPKIFVCNTKSGDRKLVDSQKLLGKNTSYNAKLLVKYLEESLCLITQIERKNNLITKDFVMLFDNVKWYLNYTCIANEYYDNGIIHIQERKLL